MTWEEISKELFEKRTAKRFILKNERTICDGFYGKCFVCSYKSDAVMLYELLNGLHEENQSLKEENKFLQKKIKTYKVGNAVLKATIDKEWK